MAQTKPGAANDRGEPALRQSHQPRPREFPVTHL